MSFLEIDKNSSDIPLNMHYLHSHNHYEFYFLLEGERSLFMDKALYIMPKNTLFVIPPFEMHKTEGGPFTRININVSKNFFDTDEHEIIYTLARRQTINLDDEIIKIKATLEKLLDYQKNNTKVNTALLKITVKMLFADLYHILPKEGKHVHNIAFEKKIRPVLLSVLKYINENYTNQINVDDIAKLFYVSRSHLARMFKRDLSFSISEYILNLKINNAKQLLISTRKSINEIAEISGFSSAVYFGLIFKKHIGISPLNFRKYKKA